MEDKIRLLIADLGDERRPSIYTVKVQVEPGDIPLEFPAEKPKEIVPEQFPEGNDHKENYTSMNKLEFF